MMERTNIQVKTSSTLHVMVVVTKISDDAEELKSHGVLEVIAKQFATKT